MVLKTATIFLLGFLFGVFLPNSGRIFVLIHRQVRYRRLLRQRRRFHEHLAMLRHIRAVSDLSDKVLQIEALKTIMPLITVVFVYQLLKRK